MPDAWLLDTNILLRMSKIDDPHHADIERVLRLLAAADASSDLPPRYLGSFGTHRHVPLTGMALG